MSNCLQPVCRSLQISELYERDPSRYAPPIGGDTCHESGVHMSMSFRLSSFLVAELLLPLARNSFQPTREVR